MGEHGVASAAVDARGVVIAWSADARHLLGHEPEEVIGHPAADLLAVALPPSALSRLAEPADWHGTVHVRHRDGHRVELELQARPLLDAAGQTQWFLTATVPQPTARLRRWALEQFPVPMALFDRDGLAVSANSAMEVVMGRPERELLGRRVGESADGRRHLPGFEGLGDVVLRVLRTGESVPFEAWLRAPGESREHAWLVSLSPLKDDTGDVLGVCLAAMDSTEQFLARRRLTMLNESSGRIGSTLDVTRTAEELAEVCTDYFADFVTVDLLDSVLAGEETAHSPGAGLLVFRRTAHRSVLDGCPEAVILVGDRHTYGEDTTPGRALTSGRARLYEADDITRQQWAMGVPERARSIETHSIHSMMAVPLRARGVTLGLSILARHRTQEPFGADDLLLAEELAARAAVCVDNARRYTRERAIALELQRSILRHHAPLQGAVEVASRYQPASSRAGIGGDWFDVIPLSGARVALVVGDVVGHGVQASATMGRLRTAVRTLADVDLAPDELLTRLDDIVLRLDVETTTDGAERPDSPGEIGATCLYAVYDPVSRRCTMAGAGHPPPALVVPDGEVEFLDLPTGPPLGLGGLPFETAEFDVPEGSVLALYTDGLIQTPDRDLDDGLAALRRALGGKGRSLEESCDGVLRDLLTDRPADDVALLLARTHALDADRVATWDVPADPTFVALARKLTCDRLAAWGLEDVSFVTELIVSELVTNAIRYGEPPIQLRLIRDTTLICEVSDASSTAPHMRRARAFDEGGRGLLLVAQLTQRWGSRHTRTGKTIWAEQTLPEDDPSQN
ncbi:SpoIIE family protein phosphatase [Streptomyces ipomoeae]|uniref:PAS domain S-box n=1 Tax=Streptomyces ipomoeae 91-03 TaxID=698759 RepID=L1KNU0_9ACTN|nr:SpoIIE family protein phosphatase [Streptomyces ipomoeae]EKX62053.1 PAS domain S-box [Streptomyces ipomoeae 91-03]MDX2692521.1 SpoIIE family protein phosphatase [Streptomyces ipomoeae]MDX2838138.1 SpoIIE family protein phosphatase [Streptomyces ipomoeae]